MKSPGPDDFPAFIRILRKKSAQNCHFLKIFQSPFRFKRQIEVYTRIHDREGYRFVGLDTYQQRDFILGRLADSLLHSVGPAPGAILLISRTMKISREQRMGDASTEWSLSLQYRIVR